MKIIFLDIDGVLNGYNKWTSRIVRISRLLHIKPKYIRRIINVFEIKERYVRRLSKIISSTGAKVVMSSSWRFVYWNIPYKDMWKDQRRLYDLLHKYNIEIIDITPSSKTGIREEEINEWLDTTDINIESFVILDDESYDLQSFVGKQLVKTSNVIEGEMIKGLPYEDTGLKRKHVKQAIRILNTY